MRSAVDALISSKKWGRANMGRICEQAARTGLLEIPEFEQYYSCLQYDLNERERKGLELFYSYLQQAGELEQTPRLDIYGTED